MKNTLRYFAFILLLPLFNCESEHEAKVTPSDTTNTRYKTGVFIISEGSFGYSNGTVSHYNPSDKSVESTVYKNANGFFAGDVLQSLTLDGDLAYLVLNGSNKIEIADRHTFKKVKTFTTPALDKPRSLIVIDDKAYISVFGSYDANYNLVDSYILVVDLKTMQIVDTIDTDEGVDNLLYNGEYLFAANYNFGFSNTIARIDPSNNELAGDQLELNAGPSGMVIDSNKDLWVITTGKSGENNGKLFRIDPTSLTVSKEIELNANPNADLAISPDGNNLFYTLGNKVFKLPITESTAPAEPLIHAADVENLYAFGVDPQSGDIYIGDALTYTIVGNIYRYAADGTFIHTFEAGISPTQFVFAEDE